MSSTCSTDLFLGNKLLTIRKKHGITQDMLGKAINLSRQQIQKYEAGETKIPASTLCEIAKTLNVDPGYFLEGINKINDNSPETSDIIKQSRYLPLKILIIEDSSSDEKITRTAIEQSGFPCEVSHVSDGIEALSLLRNIKNINVIPKPDIIFLDLNMPKKNGSEVLKDIKSDIHIKDIPIIIITNSVHTDDMTKIYKSGASGYIVKSFYPDEFFKRIGMVVEYWYNMILPSM